MVTFPQRAWRLSTSDTDTDRRRSNVHTTGAATRFWSHMFSLLMLDSQHSRRFPTFHLKNRRTFMLFITRHIPVIDYTAPTLQQVKQAVAMISSCLDRNMPVAVHCVAGLGRTGTILACYLVAMEMPANNAIIVIREWRPGSIEIPEQEAVVYEYERFINETRE